MLESTPLVREDVVRCDEPVEDVIPVSTGRASKMAARFLNWQEEEDKKEKPKRVIEIDRSQEVSVIENEPEERTDVVKSGGPTGWEIELEAGRTRNIRDQWLTAAEEVDAPPPSDQDKSSKPLWMIELEAARESGVYENDPEEREDVVREQDVNEEPNLIPELHTKNLRNRWLNR